MKLRKNLNSLSALSLEVPALSKDKEGLLKGGFCAVATVGGIGLQSENTGSCNEDCKVRCAISCVKQTCVEECNIRCNEDCNFRCTKPEGGGEVDPSNASRSEALLGFSLVF